MVVFDISLIYQYYDDPMKSTEIKNLPKEINLLRLADQGAEMAGVMDIADMSRLEPSLVSSAHKAEVSLQFGIDVEKLRYVKGHIKAKLALVCQRCLQPMDYVIDDEISLSPVFSEKDANELPSCYESVMIDNHDMQSLTALIEDELILRMPIVALHDVQDCPVKIMTKEITEEAAPNPFAVLADLKKRK
jgi:uncharacterized protein